MKHYLKQQPNYRIYPNVRQPQSEKTMPKNTQTQIQGNSPN